MRIPTLMTITILLLGCRTTQVIDADWQSESVRQQVAEIGVDGSSKVFSGTVDAPLTGRYTLGASSLDFLGSPGQSVGLGDVHEIHHTSAMRRGRTAVFGAFIGAGTGFVLGALLASGDDCSASDESFCELGEAVIEASAIAALGLSGLVAGGVIGALVGSPRIEVYRFRRDTPQQMSVSIGLGPISPPGAR